MWLAGSEMNVAWALTRHFWWQSNTLLVRDFPKYASVFLSADDFIIPSRYIREWLRLHPRCNEYQGPKIKTQNSSSRNKPKIIIDWLERVDHGFALVWRYIHARVKKRLLELDELVAADDEKRGARSECEPAAGLGLGIGWDTLLNSSNVEKGMLSRTVDDVKTDLLDPLQLGDFGIVSDADGDDRSEASEGLGLKIEESVLSF
eukprot:CAMPEP_0167746280 /NCGR_PEP_ID=MMETSP0110_2-20121227/3625_1 /TAXON_ID=629695 /ORGANISM="Gymnochlora sp., Strain CCMP2014" /LENGTH=203 /DNA_ID=CAMNT_0007631027 /DNA_START=1074 /DNA_END=1683 /DNA_ORIENTATION=+